MRSPATRTAASIGADVCIEFDGSRLAVDAVEPVVDREYLIDVSGHRIVGILGEEWGVQAVVELERRYEGGANSQVSTAPGLFVGLGEVVNAGHVIADGDAMPGRVVCLRVRGGGVPAATDEEGRSGAGSGEAQEPAADDGGASPGRVESLS